VIEVLRTLTAVCFRTYKARPAMCVRFIMFHLLCLTLAVSCGTAPAEPRAEHEARRLSPIPACAVVLPPHDPDQPQTIPLQKYWKLVFPAYREATFELHADAHACTGAAVFQDECFTGATLLTRITDEEITFGGGADGMMDKRGRSLCLVETGVMTG